jgi:4-hydroxy-2-oxoheptanedioate aldolase
MPSLPSLRQRLEAREPLLGTFVKSSDATSAEILAGAGFDFLIVDFDHSTLGLGELEQIARAAALHAVPVIVRLAPTALDQAGRVLDAGATGVQVAALSDLATAESAWRQCSYPPEGTRSLALSHRAAQFGRVSASEVLEQAAEQVVLVGQIESAAAVDALPAMLAADARVDAWFLGPLDLSVSLGKAGRPDDPLVERNLQAAAAAVLDASGVLGVFAPSLVEARRWLERGATMIAVGSDFMLLAGVADGLVSDFRRHASP